MPVQVRQRYAIDPHNVSALNRRQDEKESLALASIREERAKRLAGLKEELEKQRTSAIEALRNIERMLGKLTGKAARSSGGGGGSRGPRGEGWAIIEGALKGGKPKTAADMRAAWGDRATPISVALASYVKSGKLSKKGSGRGATYSLKGE